jgi:hypothetical protein
VAYEPRFTISPRLLSLVEMIAALRERIQGAAVGLSWIGKTDPDTTPHWMRCALPAKT